MLNIKLFSKLQASDTVSLVLISRKDGMLDYYLVSASVAYSVLSCGICEGELSGKVAYFNIRMSSIAPLLDKGIKFRIVYHGGKLLFVSDDDNIQVSLLYVESRDAIVEKAVQTYMDFNDVLTKHQNKDETLDRLRFDLKTVDADLVSAQDTYEYLSKCIEIQESRSTHINPRSVSAMQLSGWVNASSPFGFPEDAVVASSEVTDESTNTDSGETEKLKKSKELEEAKEYLDSVRTKRDKICSQISKIEADTDGLSITDLAMEKFSKIIGAASRTKELVHFCGDYAVLELVSSFLIQKESCPTMAVPGALLSLLMRDGGGKGFFLYKNSLVYASPGVEHTFVFVSKYLPNVKVDSSIITRGITEEKYPLRLRGLLTVFSAVRNKFPVVKMDMGAGQFILSNDQGEEITIKFDVSNPDTLQLRKFAKDGVAPKHWKMSTIAVPREVQGLLSLLSGELTVFVKSRKVILQSGTLFVVFGRGDVQ